ncbi:hypothetical protein N018_11810 [Pseudomonas syringae CC1557]|uniref:Uncharacterized protein n=1 Tax=Pseudomonas syringae CC1557 TaxID=1357279 RepID=W0MYA1_PSESX|nr:hypothetical protein [Pseudomonas syringae]AHG43564.1 hypothetical protein N018_11810 [Pseudomonas syringae CC1557]
MTPSAIIRPLLMVMAFGLNAFQAYNFSEAFRRKINLQIPEVQ